jgi:D-serine deaminase-like pyridoxal phosphate-dependent protein
MTTMNIHTPCLVIDGAVAQRNIESLAAYTKSKGLGLRPHTKTHKSLKLARMQIDAGAVGLAVAKVGEAKVLAEACDDLLAAYPVISPQRCEELGRLACDRAVRVVADSLAGVRVLTDAAFKTGGTLGVLVEMDIGMKRTGVQTPEASLQLAREIDDAPGLRLDGIMFYPGHIRLQPDQQQAPLEVIDAVLMETIDLWSRSGLEAAIISGGSTPTAYQSHMITRMTEIRPGTYVYNDMNTVRGGYVSTDDCAARVLVTVVSDAVPGQVVIDAGSKMLSSDRCSGAPDAGFGHVVEYPQAWIARLSEEHGMVEISGCDTRPSVGDRITIIPNHICPCVNLQDAVWWLDRDGSLETLAVDARGRVT